MITKQEIDEDFYQYCHMKWAEGRRIGKDLLFVDYLRASLGDSRKGYHGTKISNCTHLMEDFQKGEDGVNEYHMDIKLLLGDTLWFDIYNLVYEYGYNVIEIGERLGIDANTLHSEKMAMLRFLKKHLYAAR